MSKRKPSSRKERPTDLAEYLTSLRVDNGLTQGEVAARIEKNKDWICRIERGQRQRQCLRGFILYQLAEAYDAPIEVVLKKANWPQPLLLDITEEQKQRLKRYLIENL